MVYIFFIIIGSMNEIMHSKKTSDKLKVGMSVFQMHERKPSCTGFEFSES